MGLTRAVSALHPYGKLLLPVKDAHCVFEKFNKRLVREELLPHVWLAVDNSLIDRRKVVRINIEIMTVVLQNRHGTPP